jgi:epoxyqueuosine reductase
MAEDDRGDIEELTRELTGRGVGLIGFADLSPLDKASRFGFPRAISFCLPLAPQVIAGICDGPTEGYCREYDRANSLLTQLAEQVAAWLVDQGWQALARSATGDIDRAACRAPFQHKTAATLAGLGWIGKSALLVTPEYGTAARWATVLTDAPLPTGAPVIESRCGTCTACVDICPGRALTGKPWHQGTTREELVDVHACLKAMTRVSMARGNHRDICGMCIAACPWTRRYLNRGAES